MKKFIICLVIVFMGISCEKEATTVCGCSPVNYYFSLVVKNQQNADLLDPAQTGAYNKTAIKIWYKKDNVLKQTGVDVAQPLQFSSTSTMPFHSIRSNIGNVSLALNIKEFYLDFGNGDQDTITFDSYNNATGEAVNIKLNGTLLAKEPSAPAGYPPIYVVVK